MRTPDGIQFVNEEAEIFISAVRKRKGKNKTKQKLVRTLLIIQTTLNG
jgi:hypothetical protein